MPKVLKYFELNGLAEPIRYILYYTKQEFEDVRYDLKSWPIKEIKDALPFGQFPILEEDGKVLNQTVAIARYVSANTELLPSDPWQQAILDAAVLTVFDFHKCTVKYIYAKTPEEKAEVKKDFLGENVKFFFSRFEKMLKENNGFFGGKLSWADFMLVGLIECANLFLQEEIQTGYPNTTKLMETIRALPGVKEYIKKRKPYVV